LIVWADFIFPPVNLYVIGAAHMAHRDSTEQRAVHEQAIIEASRTIARHERELREINNRPEPMEELSETARQDASDFNMYQAVAATTFIVEGDYRLPYLVCGLANEAGEVAGKYKKFLRGDVEEEEFIEQVTGELGDVLWYLATLANELDIQLDTVAMNNLSKLESRMERGQIRGNGDNR